MDFKPFCFAKQSSGSFFLLSRHWQTLQDIDLGFNFQNVSRRRSSHHIGFNATPISPYLTHRKRCSIASCQKYEQRKDNAQWEGSAAFFDDDDDDSTDDAGDDEMTKAKYKQCGVGNCLFSHDYDNLRAKIVGTTTG